MCCGRLYRLYVGIIASLLLGLPLSAAWLKSPGSSAAIQAVTVDSGAKTQKTEEVSLPEPRKETKSSGADDLSAQLKELTESSKNTVRVSKEDLETWRDLADIAAKQIADEKKFHFGFGVGAAYNHNDDNIGVGVDLFATLRKGDIMAIGGVTILPADGYDGWQRYTGHVGLAVEF